MTTAITIWMTLGDGRRAATTPLFTTTLTAMASVLRTVCGVLALAVANIVVGRLITGPLRDLPTEHRATADLRRVGGRGADDVAQAVSRSSDTSRAITLGLALTGLLQTRGQRWQAAAPGLAMAMASATHVTASSLVGRERPAGERRGTEQPTSSFPSGHVGAMTALAVVLGRIASPLPAPARFAVRSALVGYLGLLGWSRVHNGQHYPSDVAAGYVNGVVCGRLAWTAVHGSGR